MAIFSATALAHPNIALIKYWGNRDHELRIPENGSISFNLDGLFTKTTVRFDSSLEKDFLEINGQSVIDSDLKRVSQFLRYINEISGKHYFADVKSENNFPIAAGIASSAAAFAALTLAATSALEQDLSQRELSRIARRGSGSACRSIPEGYVEWKPGRSDEDSYAFSIAPQSHWDLVDIVAIVKGKHKTIGSTAGHAFALTSPIQKARVADAPRRLALGRNAIMQRDFSALAEIVEIDSNLMHAVMMTSTPGLLYWEPATITIMKAVPVWRQEGIPVCYTLDAGPNVHVIVQSSYVSAVKSKLLELPGIENILVAPVGGAAVIVH
jgi:diphosphomevalonate decarboxylase